MGIQAPFSPLQVNNRDYSSTWFRSYVLFTWSWFAKETAIDGHHHKTPQKQQYGHYEARNTHHIEAGDKFKSLIGKILWQNSGTGTFRIGQGWQKWPCRIVLVSWHKSRISFVRIQLNQVGTIGYMRPLIIPNNLKLDLYWNCLEIQWTVQTHSPISEDRL